MCSLVSFYISEMMFIAMPLSTYTSPKCAIIADSEEYTVHNLYLLGTASVDNSMLCDY